MRKIFLILIICFVMSNVSAYTLNGNTVYINDANVYLSATPATTPESQYVYVNLTPKLFTGNIDFAVGVDSSNAIMTSFEIQRTVSGPNGSSIEWVSYNLTTYSYTYDGKNTWYVGRNAHVVAGTDYKARFFLTITPNTAGKYDIAVKPSAESIATAIANGHFYLIDPWWNNTNLVSYSSYPNYWSMLDDGTSSARIQPIFPYSPQLVAQFDCENALPTDEGKYTLTSTTPYYSSTDKKIGNYACNFTAASATTNTWFFPGSGAAGFPMQLTGGISFEFWFKTQSGFVYATHGGSIMGTAACGSDSAAGPLVYLQNQTHMGLCNDPGVNNPMNEFVFLNTGLDLVQDNNWHHYVLTYTQDLSANGVKLYVDGVNTANATFTKAVMYAPKNPFNIGDDGMPGWPWTIKLSMIDEIRLYNGILTQEQVTNNYNNGTGRKYQEVRLQQNYPFNGNLAVFYRFENNTLDEQYKISGILSGILVNNATDCKVGTCYKFNGSSANNIIGGSSLDNSAPAYSVSSWVKYYSATIPAVTYPSPWNLGSDIAGGGARVELDGASGNNFTCQDPSSGLGFNAGINLAEVQQGGHLVVVWDKSRCITYWNGQLRANGSMLINENPWVSKPVIGWGWANVDARAWNGSVDEFMIFNRSLSSAEVLYLYNNGTGRVYDATLPSSTMFTDNVNTPTTGYDPSKWQIATTRGCVADATQYRSVPYSCNSNNNGGYWINTSVSSTTDFTVEAYGMQTSNLHGMTLLELKKSSAVSYCGANTCVAVGIQDDTDDIVYSCTMSTFINTTLKAKNNTWYRFRIKAFGDRNDIYVDDKKVATCSGSGSSVSYWEAQSVLLAKESVSTDYNWFFDDVNVYTEKTSNLFTSKIENPIAPYWISDDGTIMYTKMNVTNTSAFYIYENGSIDKSDGNAVFEIYDDFNDGSLNTSKWQNDGAGSESGGKLIVQSGSNTNKVTQVNPVYLNCSYCGLMAASSYLRGSYDSDFVFSQGTALTASSILTNGSEVYMHFSQATGVYSSYYNGTGVVATGWLGSVGYSSTAFYPTTIWLHNNVVNFTRGPWATPYRWSLSGAPTYNLSGDMKLKFFSQNGGGGASWDWVWVAKKHMIEPTVTYGTKETGEWIINGEKFTQRTRVNVTQNVNQVDGNFNNYQVELNISKVSGRQIVIVDATIPTYNGIIPNITGVDNLSSFRVSANGGVPVYNYSAEATGGNITRVGGYTIHTFTTNGTFDNSNSKISNIEILVIGGGGSGGTGQQTYAYGGGGGAGGVIYYTSYPITATSYPVTVGLGGIPSLVDGSYTNGYPGNRSVFGPLIALGGGEGAAWGITATSGFGSGGGGSCGGGVAQYTGAIGTFPQGYNGANGVAYSNTASCSGGGGGGASATGTAGASGAGGAGGAGISSRITGTLQYYAAGGGAGGGSSGGAGWNSISGSGGAGTARGTSGVNGTGSGGGGSAVGGSGGSYGGGYGGNGIVIVRYPTPTYESWSPWFNASQNGRRIALPTGGNYLLFQGKINSDPIANSYVTSFGTSRATGLLLTILYPNNATFVTTNTPTFGYSATGSGSLDHVDVVINQTDSGIDIPSITSCYQESANTSNQTGIDGSCSLNYNGTLINQGFATPNNLVDGDWNTYDGSTGAAQRFNITYIKPQYATNNSKIIFKMYNATADPTYRVFNYSIPPGCWNYSNQNISFKVYSSVVQSWAGFLCYDGVSADEGTGWKIIHQRTSGSSSQLRFYEEAVQWEISRSFSNSITSNTTLNNQIEYSWYFRYTDTDNLSDVSETRNIYTAIGSGGSGPVTTLGCMVASQGCFITAPNECNYVS